MGRGMGTGREEHTLFELVIERARFVPRET